MSKPAPLYIPVGPQNSGKTTALKRHAGPGVVDISLDDQPDVYLHIPTADFVSFHECQTAPDRLDQRIHFYKDRVLHGKSWLDRMQEEKSREQFLILQRLSGQLSPQNFAVRVHQYHQANSTGRMHRMDDETPSNLAEDLISAVETIEKNTGSESNVTFPDTVAVFCFESLFRPHAMTNQSAIDRATRLVRETPRHVPVAWGNTNVKSKDFERILSIAHQSRRPVIFWVWGESSTLPKCSWEALVERNVQRFLQTGKYVPIRRMYETVLQFNQLVDSAKHQARYVASLSKVPNATGPSRMLEVDSVELGRALAFMASSRWKTFPSKSVPDAIHLDDGTRPRKRRAPVDGKRANPSLKRSQRG